MAVAVGPSSYEEQEKKQKGYLEISAYDFYFNKVRPHMEEMTLKCRTDEELMRTLEKVINSSDSSAIRKNYEELGESFNVLNEAITDPSYFNGVMKKAPEAEKEMVRQLITLIGDLKLLIKCENPVPAEEQKARERLNYRKPTEATPIGENEDFVNHNMKVLTEPKPKERIPNK